MRRAGRIPLGSMLVAVLTLVALGSGGIASAGTWVARYNGPANSLDSATAIAVDAAGNVYVTGDGVVSPGTDSDSATIKYDSNGNQVWVALYKGPGNSFDTPHALAVDAAGNVYVAGGSIGSGTLHDYFTIKYDSNGSEVWVKRYNGPGNSQDFVTALAVDAAGNVYVTGGSIGSGTDYDHFTIKYRSSDGAVLWEKRYNGPGNSSDVAYALAIDAAGNVYVTGDSVGSGTTSLDYATIKYAPDGTQLWVARYNGPGNYFDQAFALAVDAAGNVYVTGQSAGSGTDYDFATIKYDSNGNEVWVKRYNGPGNGFDRAIALAVDAAGNVYVTGDSVGSGTDYDYATIKYDSNGNEVWVKRYNGPGNSSDYAHALAVDAKGNVYVTGGGSVGSGGGSDYATIKYAPDGTQLWVARYNGPGNGWDEAHALAMDAKGNVYVTGESDGSGTHYDYATIKYSTTHTPAGDEVSVTPVDPTPAIPGKETPVTVTFTRVTSPGETTVTSSGTGTPPPAGFKLGNPPVYFTIETTTGYTGSIKICIDYSGINYGNESQLRLFHKTTTGGWQDVTDPGYPDTVHKIICGTVTSLSLFGMFEPGLPFSGFFPPVDNLPAVNTAKAGSAIPVKFSLGGNLGLGILAAGYPTSLQIACDSTDSFDSIEETVTAGSSSLSYDASLDQYVYVWKTDGSWAGTCRQLVVKLSDGTYHWANFNFVK